MALTAACVRSPTLSLANQEMWGTENALRHFGFSDAAIRTTMKGMHLLFSLRPLLRRGVISLGDLWFVSYDPYLNPRDVWPAVKAPALILFGTHDDTVPSEESMRYLTSILERQGHVQSRIYLFPQKGHALGGTQKSEDPAYVRMVTAWIHAVTSDKAVAEAVLPTGAIDPTLRWYGMGNQATPGVCWACLCNTTTMSRSS